MVQSQNNYISVNGIVTQDLNSINAELQNNFKAIYGENVNLESNTADGQWLNILAQQKVDALDFQVQLFNNLDVDSVVGLPQQILYKLNGLTIKDFTYSFVYVNVYVTQNVTLTGLDEDIANVDGTGYTTTDINGKNWILTESISLVQSEEPYLLLFRAQELGQITALANTITIMSTIVAGVREVNNPANNFITGQTGESAAEFRTRRNRSMQAPSQGFKESIEGQLLALNDVSDVKVYDNKDDVSIDGVQVIVQGGTSDEIGNIIYNNLPPGINTQGAYQAPITVNNRNKVLNYDKPNPIPIMLKGTIESLSGYPNDIDLDYVKKTLASEQFMIGERAESANITTALKNILGDTGSPYDIEISLGATSGEWTEPASIGTYTSNSVIFDGTNYIAVGDNGQIAKSTDLENWTVQTVGHGNWKSIAYGGEKYAVVGDSNEIAISTDLSTWTVEQMTLNIPSAEFTECTSISYLNNKFIVTGFDEISEGYVHNLITESDDLASFHIENFDDYRISNKSIFVDDKYIFVGGDSSNGYIKTCSESFSRFNTIRVGNQMLTDIIFDGTNYVAVGKNGQIAISTDLASWNTKTVSDNNWNSIAYNNGLYMAVGTNGYVAMSEDLTNWTISQTGTDDITSVVNNGTDFVTVGSGVTTYEPPTEEVWEEILTPSGLADFFVMTVAGMDNLEVIA